MQTVHRESFRGLETACEENFRPRSILLRSDTKGGILEQPGYRGGLYSKDMAFQVEALSLSIFDSQTISAPQPPQHRLPKMRIYAK